MDITALPQQAQIFLSIIEFDKIGAFFQKMMFDLVSIMSNESLSNNDKARELALIFELYDEVDQTTILEYVNKYSKFSNKRWIK